MKRLRGKIYHDTFFSDYHRVIESEIRRTFENNYLIIEP